MNLNGRRGTLYVHYTLPIYIVSHYVPCTGVLKCRGVSDNLGRRGAGTAWSVTWCTVRNTTGTSLYSCTYVMAAMRPAQWVTLHNV